MKIANMHRLSLMGTIGLPCLGLVDGSPLLATGAQCTMVIAFGLSFFLHPQPRGRAFRYGVHGATVLGLFFCLRLIGVAAFDAGLLIVMLGIFNRLALHQSPRDDFILVAAAGVLMTAATVVTPGFLYFGLLVLFLPMSLWTLMCASLIASEIRGNKEGVFRPMLSRAVPTLRARIAASSLSFMLIGYLGSSLFPRFQFGRWMTPGFFANLGRASTHMTLSSGGVNPVDDGAILLKLKAESDIPLPSEGLYARLFALDVFDGREWKSASNERAFPLFKTRQVASRPAKFGTKVHLKRLVHPPSAHPIAAIGLYAPAAMSIRYPMQVESGTWITQTPQATHDIQYYVDLNHDAPSQLVSREQMQRLTQLPDNISPRVLQLAEQLAQQAQGSGQRAKVNAVLSYFGKSYSYSLDPLPGQSKDVLERFIFEAKQGHCELYAGAVAVLLRAMGVPARVATGYYGGYLNRTAGQLEMTSEDAHAWVEVLEPNGHWRWIDATPAGLRTRRATQGWTWFRDFFAGLESFWYESVIDFDDKKRKAWMKRLFGDWRGEGGFQGFFSNSASSNQVVASETSSLGFFYGVFVFFAGVGGLGLFWVRRFRRSPAQLGLQLRQRLGAKPQDFRPNRVLLEALPPAQQPDFRVAIELYERVRFGGEVEAKPGLERALARLQKTKSSTD